MDIYGAVRKEKGEKGLVPQLYQGQYVDEETGLAYNRFRYYDNESGSYISQDPIGLGGTGFNLYLYVKNPNDSFDLLGLECWRKKRQEFWKNEGLNNPHRYSQRNLDRMAQGRAPRIQVEVMNRKTGQIEIKDVSMELHHTYLPQRGAGDIAHEPWNLQRTTPWGHEAMDPYRHTGSDLIRIIKGTSTW